MKIRRIKRKTRLEKQFAEAIATTEAEVEYQKLMIVESLLRHMKRVGVSRSELAKRMNVGPSRITAMLNGSNNLTIETLVRAGRAVGADLQQTFVPSGQVTLPSISFLEEEPEKKTAKKSRKAVSARKVDKKPSLKKKAKARA